MRLRFELFVDDVKISTRFYGAVLGLMPPSEFDPSGYVPVGDGEVIIGLQPHATLPPDHHFSPGHFRGPRGIGVEIVIEVDDVHAAFDRAVELAAPLGGAIEPLEVRPWGRSDFRVIDPDGYYVRVTS
jgi:lactoylglutathione lyase